MKAVIILCTDNIETTAKFHNEISLLVPPITFNFTKEFQNDLRNNDLELTETLEVLDKVNVNPRGFVAILTCNTDTEIGWIRKKLNRARYSVATVYVQERGEELKSNYGYSGIVKNETPELFADGVKKCAKNLYYLKKY